MKCPKCQAEIPDGSKFCNECGSNISKSSAQSAAEGASLGAQPTMIGAAPSAPMDGMWQGDGVSEAADGLKVTCK